MKQRRTETMGESIKFGVKQEFAGRMRNFFRVVILGNAVALRGRLGAESSVRTCVAYIFIPTTSRSTLRPECECSVGVVRHPWRRRGGGGHRLERHRTGTRAVSVDFARVNGSGQAISLGKKIDLVVPAGFLDPDMVISSLRQAARALRS